MRNWSTDIEKSYKGDPEQRTIWQLEQLINFGLADGQKIDRKILQKYFDKLQIDPMRRKLFALFLAHGK